LRTNRTAASGPPLVQSVIDPCFHSGRLMIEKHFSISAMRFKLSDHPVVRQSAAEFEIGVSDDRVPAVGTQRLLCVQHTASAVIVDLLSKA